MAAMLVLAVLVSVVAAVPVEVFLIPHSHCDAGWIKTVDAYYEEQVQYILSASVNATARDPSRRFHWAEVVFFQRWFDAQPAAVQATVRDLVARGQWEFVHGGYVMEDEASATPAARIHQLTLGHEYLERTLGVRPRIAWSIDPFGSSGVSPALFRGSGYRVLVNDRISLRLKEERMATRELQFMWRGSASQGERSTLFTHTLDSWYWLPGGYNWDLGDPPITPENIVRKATELANTFLQRAAWFRTPHLLFPFGHDFAFQDADIMFDNMDLLVAYINANMSSTLRVRYGTLSEYFAAVGALPTPDPAAWPAFSRDYVPFEDNPWAGWWTGHLTSRPHLKRAIRTLDARLHAADALYALSSPVHAGVPSAVREGVYADLERARATSALLNHHDGITGTSRQLVVDDYLARLAEANMAATAAHAHSAAWWLTNGTAPGPALREASAAAPVTDLAEATAARPLPLILSNPLGHVVTAADPIRVAMAPADAARLRVAGVDGTPVLAQVSVADAASVDVWFVRTLPALSLVTYGMYLDAPSAWTVVVEPAEVPLQCVRGGSAPPDVVLANDVLAATFSGVDGRLTSLTDVASGTPMRVQQTLMAYATTKSGAYLFTPSGPAVPIATAACPLALVHWAGPVADVLVWTLLENATATAPDGRLQLRATLVHGAADLSHALQMEVSAPGAISPNREIVLRWSTDLANNRVLWADDGLELRAHAFDATWSDLIASNYRSVLSTALLADGPDPATAPRRLAVLTSHAHGAASLAVGELEVMVQRRLMQDDGLGMNEAMDERAPFSSALWLVLETGAVSPTTVLTRKRLARQLDAVVPLPILVPADPTAWAATRPDVTRTALSIPLPDAVQLLSLHARYPPGTPPGPATVVLRLAHAVAVTEEPELSGPARLDLDSLWAPPLVVAEMAATGLTLGPTVFETSVPLPTVELSALDLRTWVLTLASS